MINTTSRHESTSMSGKIQCSSILYEHLAEYSADVEGPLYEFTPRGFVEMKGKSRCYTYWLDRGSKYNERANPGKIKTLHDKVQTVLSKKKWKKRKYFNYIKKRGSSVFGGGEDDAFSTTMSTAMESMGDSSSPYHPDTEGSIATAESSVIDPETGQSGDDDATADDASTFANTRSSSDHDTVSFTELKKTRCKLCISLFASSA